MIKGGGGGGGGGGGQIRIKLNEKHTVPRRLGKANVQPLRVEKLYLTRCG